jgi:DNA-directed RNA polymerase I subunit RPA1
MFDANGIVCTDIHKATLEVLSSNEVLKMSVCRITSPKVFVGESPHIGGLHDPLMGSLDTRIPCATCGLRRDCPGHLGHIEFPLYVYHPTLLSSLVRLLKMVCFHCCRLKIDERTARVFVKKFQLLKNGMLQDAEKFEFLHGHSSGGDRFQRFHKGISKSEAHEDIDEEKRVQLIQLFLRIKEIEEHRKALCQSLQGDISETHTSVEAWTSVRRKFLSMATSRSVCSHCNRVFSTNVKQTPGGVGIQLTWSWGSEKPFSRLTNLRHTSLCFLQPKESNLGNDHK